MTNNGSIAMGATTRESIETNPLPITTYKAMPKDNIDTIATA
ncbi:MAG TPA: hypothetical protein ACFCUD_12100 [Cyclobacteriaceae bacterium]